MLLYLAALFGLIFGSIYSREFGRFVGIVASIGLALAAYAIANDQKRGYNLAVTVSALALVPFLWALIVDGPGELFSADLVGLLIPPAVSFALLAHPRSRDHQRIWFS